MKGSNNHWFVYILHCKDGTYYTGITNNLANRLKTHNSGNGARYTRTRRPVKLVYQEKCSNQSKAMKRERKIKQMPRARKTKLIRDYKQSKVKR
ncbi:MAG: GIY-YIG nuclease family protein [Planctomycetes bacterium]|nr:GIY-YIG nuclease family protein [Planctomycetota bacterium]